MLMGQCCQLDRNHEQRLQRSTAEVEPLHIIDSSVLQMLPTSEADEMHDCGTEGLQMHSLQVHRVYTAQPSSCCTNGCLGRQWL